MGTFFVGVRVGVAVVVAVVVAVAVRVAVAGRGGGVAVWGDSPEVTGINIAPCSVRVGLGGVKGVTVRVRSCIFEVSPEPEETKIGRAHV